MHKNQCSGTSGATQEKRYTMANALALAIKAMSFGRTKADAVAIASEFTGISCEEVNLLLENSEALWQKMKTSKETDVERGGTIVEALSLVIIAIDWHRFFSTAVEVAANTTSINKEEIFLQLRDVETYWEKIRISPS